MNDFATYRRGRFCSGGASWGGLFSWRRLAAATLRFQEALRWEGDGWRCKMHDAARLAVKEGIVRTSKPQQPFLLFLLNCSARDAPDTQI